MNTSNDPLHGKKLADILDELLDYYGGFEGLSHKIEIRCFCIDPSVKSSLRFLRTIPWAREKVELIFVRLTPKGQTETVASGNTPLIIKLYQSVKYL
jgi:uncharacterized protein (DUF2132 family)